MPVGFFMSKALADVKIMILNKVDKKLDKKFNKTGKYHRNNIDNL